MERTFNMEGQCFVPLDTGFNFASSPDVPLTPTSSPRSEWVESGPLDLNHLYNNAYFWINSTFPSSSFMSDPVGPETGDLPYQHVVHGHYATMDYQHMSHTNTVDVAPVSPISPFTMPSAPGTCDSYSDVGTIPSPQALSRLGSITSMSSWSCSMDSPSSDLSENFSERRYSDVSNCLAPEDYASPLRSSRSICEMKSPPMRRDLSKEDPVSLQRKVPKQKEQPFRPLPAGTTIIKKATGECDYPGCNKAFRRIEHLKRHKQAKHGEGENNYSCEFCGKDKFNRYDNLQTHRRLHTRNNKRYRSIKFVPAAVAIIEEEDLTRKRRVTFGSRR